MGCSDTYERAGLFENFKAEFLNKDENVYFPRSLIVYINTPLNIYDNLIIIRLQFLLIFIPFCYSFIKRRNRIGVGRGIACVLQIGH